MTIHLEMISTEFFFSLLFFFSMAGSLREVISNLLHTRVVILTNTATTATINTSMMKRGMTTMTICAITHSQRIQFPSVREEGDTRKSR